MNIVIIKYNAGNIRSVDFALRRMGIEAEITDDPQKIRSADKVIFPGVGAAATTMDYLVSRGLDNLIRSLQQPVLGICLGQQLMCDRSEEGDTKCIGIFDEPVLKFPPRDKVPHMGWNQLLQPEGPLFRGVEPGAYVYFVHSYYVPVCGDTAAGCHYICDFSAAMQKDNFYATQFHPEKSGPTGQKILENFIAL
jgi:glutamine amidotransferase